IPRPLNAFMLYRRDHAKKCPGLTASELSIAIGLMWRAETPERQAYYRMRAKREKEEHELLYPDYAFRPIRRGQGRQAKKLQAMAVQAAASGVPFDVYRQQAKKTHKPMWVAPNVDAMVCAARLMVMAEECDGSYDTKCDSNSNGNSNNSIAAITSKNNNSGSSRKSPRSKRGQKPRRSTEASTRSSTPAIRTKEEPEDMTIGKYSRRRGQRTPSKRIHSKRNKVAVAEPVAAEDDGMTGLIKQECRSPSPSWLSSTSLSSCDSALDDDSDDDDDDDDDDDSDDDYYIPRGRTLPQIPTYPCTSIQGRLEAPPSPESEQDMECPIVARPMYQDAAAPSLPLSTMEPLDGHDHQCRSTPPPTLYSYAFSPSLPPSTPAMFMKVHTSYPFPDMSSYVLSPNASVEPDMSGCESTVSLSDSQTPTPMEEWSEDSLYNNNIIISSREHYSPELKLECVDPSHLNSYMQALPQDHQHHYLHYHHHYHHETLTPVLASMATALVPYHPSNIPSPSSSPPSGFHSASLPSLNVVAQPIPSCTQPALTFTHKSKASLSSSPSSAGDRVSATASPSAATSMSPGLLTITASTTTSTAATATKASATTTTTEAAAAASVAAAPLLSFMSRKPLPPHAQPAMTDTNVGVTLEVRISSSNNGRAMVAFGAQQQQQQQQGEDLGIFDSSNVQVAPEVVEMIAMSEMQLPICWQ
ncbi:hypothetical protein DFQ26_009048, partial [Actinomortierella ambigua]